MEERARAGQGHLLSPQELDRGGGVEGLVHDEGEAIGHGGVDVERAGHVGEREHQGEAVVLPQVQGFGHPHGRGLDGQVGVAGALGLRGGAGGVVQPPHRGVGRPHVVGGGRREVRRVALGQLPVGDEDLGVGTLGQGPGHGLEVEAPPGRRDDQQLGPGLFHDEADLALPVDGKDGVLDCAEPAQGPHQDHRLEPGRQLPRHHVALAHAVGGQARGDLLAAVAVVAEPQALAIRINGHVPLGRLLGPADDQLPDVGGIKHGRAPPRI